MSSKINSIALQSISEIALIITKLDLTSDFLTKCARQILSAKNKGVTISDEEIKLFSEKYNDLKELTKTPLLTSKSLQDIVGAGGSNATDSQSSRAAINPVDLEKRALAELIYLVKGVDAGRNAWYYVLVERPKLQLFLKALNDDIIHLEKYGKILYSAYGDEPPAEITGKLKAEYGIK